MTPAKTTPRRQSCRRRHLAPADPVEVLRSEISQIGAMLDRRRGTAPGTGEASLYWCWTPDAPLHVLQALHHDAALVLCDATADAGVPPYSQPPEYLTRDDAFGTNTKGTK